MKTIVEASLSKPYQMLQRSTHSNIGICTHVWLLLQSKCYRVLDISTAQLYIHVYLYHVLQWRYGYSQQNNDSKDYSGEKSSIAAKGNEE